MTRWYWRGILASLAVAALTLLFFWQILLTNLILAGVDTFLYFYPYKAYAAEALRQGRLPLWNPHLFMGAPLLANSQVGLFYPLNWPWLWLDAPKQVAWSIGLHIALAGLFMLALARQSLRLSWAGALTAAVIFALGGYLGAQVEHLNQLNAAAWLPLLFLLYDFGMQRPRRWFWFLLLALIVALTLLAGHAQTVFISLFGLGLSGLWRGGEAARQRGSESGKSELLHDEGSSHPGMVHFTPSSPHSLTLSPLHRTAASTRRFLATLWPHLLAHLWPLVLVSLLAAALAAIQLLPTAELSTLSIRSGGLSFRETVAFSLRPTSLHYTLLPPLGLDLSQVLGEAFGEWVAYIGVSGFILALLGGVSAIWRPDIRRFVFVAGSGLVLSLGLYSGPIYITLYYLMPGFDLFRVPARWLLLYAFGVAILAGSGLETLDQPAQLRTHLASLWHWLRSPRWRAALFPGLLLLFLLALLLWKTPPLLTLTAWLLLALVTVGLILYSLTQQQVHHPRELGLTDRKEHRFFKFFYLFYPCSFPSVSQNLVAAWQRYVSRFTFHAPTTLLLFLLLTELFWATQSLNYNQPTAPQAYHSMRNATAFLLAADPPESGPPGRFLSLSGIVYDPGDLRELEQIYGPHLSAKGLYNLIVATKEKEVLFFNLPMLYGLQSVDGYDGGVLPLAQFVTLQRLFLPPDDLSIDGRLREKLRYVPSGRLLSLLNTRWIITDKVFDVWIDDVFYDLQFPARLKAGGWEDGRMEEGENGRGGGWEDGRMEEGEDGRMGEKGVIVAGDLPHFPATAIGVVSHLEGAAGLPDGTPVAELALTFADGETTTLTVKAGADTAEGSYTAGVAHAQARVGVAWPYEGAGVDYIAVYPLPEARPFSRQVSQISVRATLPEGQFVLRGLSLIHQPTTTSRSVILSTEGEYRQVHSGDVKIYENLAVLPRAFVVHEAERVDSDDQAITTLQQSTFDPRTALVRLRQNGEQGGKLVTGQPSAQDQATIVMYEPERVVIEASLDSPGWLVLTDTYYPGWQATVDGGPVEIFQADIMFRAIEVPAGEHTVVFEFKPRSLQLGALVSGLAGVVWLVGLVVAGRGGKR